MLSRKFIRAIMAGICISISGTVYLSVGGGIPGAVLFSIGLLLVFELNLDLFTGKVWKEDLPSIILILIGNITACIMMGAIIGIIRPDLVSVADGIVEHKLAEQWWQVILLGAMCNFMIYFAAVKKKPLITVLCVVTFILSGFEHSIANTFYMAVSTKIGTLQSVWWLFLNILGNALGGIGIYQLHKLTGDLF